MRDGSSQCNFCINHNFVINVIFGLTEPVMVGRSSTDFTISGLLFPAASGVVVSRLFYSTYTSW